jgi:hypothetical protein
VNKSQDLGLFAAFFLFTIQQIFGVLLNTDSLRTPNLCSVMLARENNKAKHSVIVAPLTAFCSKYCTGELFQQANIAISFLFVFELGIMLSYGRLCI